ncbi:MAG: hypothetical protein O3A56_07880 [Proteobacteria bacterium]|nr:hypothetical protein [Pseudomonadota bacterium]MDA1031357.1 hypothetical protein [Pseudomonadota bacterium]
MKTELTTPKAILIGMSFIAVAIASIPSQARAADSSIYANCQGNDSTRWDSCVGTFTYANGYQYVGERLKSDRRKDKQ